MHVELSIYNSLEFLGSPDGTTDAYTMTKSFGRAF